jgi:Holliday junction resolvase RusA-like endonuclease
MPKASQKKKTPTKTVPKKNSQQIIMRRKKPIIIQSQQYLIFEQNCAIFLKKYARHITTPINLKCTFFVPDKRKRDVVNLLNAIQDVLVKYDVLADDNYNIVASVDGTRIKYQKGREETVIVITDFKEVKNDI